MWCGEKFCQCVVKQCDRKRVYGMTEEQLLAIAARLDLEAALIRAQVLCMKLQREKKSPS